MERKFYTNDFEQLLKENADQFKMIPSKKVWHGIYNDIHPGRRWPSIAIGLLFVFTLVLVGHLNTQQSQHSYLTNAKKNIELQNSFYKNENNSLTQQPFAGTSEKNITLNDRVILSANHKTKEQLNGSKESGSKENLIAASNNTNNIDAVKEKISTEEILPIAETGNIDLFVNIKIAGLQNIKTPTLFISHQSNRNAPADVASLNSINKSSALTPSEQISINDESVKNLKNSAFDKSVTSANNEPKNKIANAAAHIKIHRNSKVNWAYYISPSVSYRTYSKQGNNEDQIFLGYINTSVNTSFNRTITHRPSIGLEAGTAMKYSLTKKLKFTSGFQVNYSAYSIQANNIHPIIATLILHDENSGTRYPISSISYFGNGPGSVPENLHNYSFQLSIPVGFEYQITGSDHIKFSAAGSLQPSLVVANQAYILSTDKRNYLTEASLSRHWNIGTNIGTFVSFNSNKFKWQIGPQVNYQLLSTYTNKYHVREHYINYGIRVGVSNIIK